MQYNIDYETTLQNINTLNIDNFNPKNLYDPKHAFITENSKDITETMLKKVDLLIDRSIYVTKLAKLLINMEIAIAIEASIFEFSLIHATINNIDAAYVDAIYDDKFIDLYDNLDLTSRFNNINFRDSILAGKIPPRMAAFLSPIQINPKSWATILNKIKFKETTEKNMASTDAYLCDKCGERKAKTTEIQLRSADEPSNFIIQCLECHNTWMV